MEIVIRYFDGCSSWRIAEERLRTALTWIGRPDISPSTQLVEDQPDAERSGFCGSPTILIDGCDPFAEASPGAAAMACRIYHTPDGMQRAPTVEQLVEVIGRIKGKV